MQQKSSQNSIMSHWCLLQHGKVCPTTVLAAGGKDCVLVSSCRCTILGPGKIY